MKKILLVILGFHGKQQRQTTAKKLGARDERVHISLDVPTFDLSFYLSVF